MDSPSKLEGVRALAGVADATHREGSKQKGGLIAKLECSMEQRSALLGLERRRWKEKSKRWAER
jgi:hypothetical protein